MAKDKIGVSTLFSISQEFNLLTRILPQLNVRHIEIVDDGLHALNARRVKILNKLKKDYGLEYTVHAPFADINLASPNPTLLRAMINHLEKSIRHAQHLDCLLWVFHPGSKTGLSFFYPEMEWRTNMESIKKLLAIAEKYGIKIVVENLPEPYPLLMKNVDEFSRFYEEFEGDVGFALDIGHANINDQVMEFLTKFQKKITHMHLSDNNGDSDTHLGVGCGTINWTATTELIKSINYDGLLMVESIERIEESIKALGQLFS